MSLFRDVLIFFVFGICQLSYAGTAFDKESPRSWRAVGSLLAGGAFSTDVGASNYFPPKNGIF